MTMETYDLRVEETDGAGITAALYNDDGTISKSVGVRYADHGIDVERDGGSPSPIEREVTLDATYRQFEVGRSDGGFEFKLVGDGQVVERVRIDDSEWGLE